MTTEVRERSLTEEQCWELLAGQQVGRLAVNDAHGPVILPVNYVVHAGTVVIRSDPGTKRAAAVHSLPAAFEVDHVDDHRRLGWSVLVRGRLVEVTDPAERSRLDALALAPYVGGAKTHYLQLIEPTVSGRRIPLPTTTPEEWFDREGLGHTWRGQDATDLLG